jgi:hypothetical protein
LKLQSEISRRKRLRRPGHRWEGNIKQVLILRRMRVMRIIYKDPVLTAQ